MALNKRLLATILLLILAPISGANIHIYIVSKTLITSINLGIGILGFFILFHFTKP
uniref:Uncharacterized protein n=1 Tax=viral metagenome TaxID=1070528 RepID=A0A6M3KDJ0_9ZZZZ